MNYTATYSPEDNKLRLYSLSRLPKDLLDNELKHLPVHSHVWLDVRAVGQEAVVLVEDDGAGFDPEIVDHVFHRRVRGRASRGHGLGLAFVAAVIRVHGGTLEAQNRPTGGACIRLVLPRSGSTEQSAQVTSGDVSARLVPQ